MNSLLQSLYANPIFREGIYAWTPENDSDQVLSFTDNLNLIGNFLLQPTNGDDVCFQLKVLFSHLQVEFLPMRNQLDC